MVSRPACVHRKSRLVRVGSILIFSKETNRTTDIDPQPLSIFAPRPARRQIFANVANILTRKLTCPGINGFANSIRSGHGNDPNAKRPPIRLFLSWFLNPICLRTIVRARGRRFPGEGEIQFVRPQQTVLIRQRFPHCFRFRQTQFADIRCIVCGRFEPRRK